jgi:Asp/Glu/hydantoin racemase
MSQTSDRILVINPNSTEAVTVGIDKAMEPLRMPGGPAIECVTLKEGPPGIDTQAHVESVVAPITAMVKGRDNDCSAFVIACYSDPGLHAAREVTSKPVLGIAECGILTALTLGQRFGVISILRRTDGAERPDGRRPRHRPGRRRACRRSPHLQPHGRGRRRASQ